MQNLIPWVEIQNWFHVRSAFRTSVDLEVNRLKHWYRPKYRFRWLSRNPTWAPILKTFEIDSPSHGGPVETKISLWAALIFEQAQKRTCPKLTKQTKLWKVSRKSQSKAPWWGGKGGWWKPHFLGGILKEKLKKSGVKWANFCVKSAGGTQVGGILRLLQCWCVLTDPSSERENLRFFTLQVPGFWDQNLKTNLH